ncbi:hypothetical protein HYFRA_00005872 [Hymenoscyphus fraxineus]|uniref:Uncharacterized protein n=1 Tax=Hymenoscyphus fraxineus TaxID=746836 RepID=A0A9N9KZD7_9HELO|nr:hypothetical protein HYFRA_00005872 [Hymenoscyphus fraxineus]
MLPGETNSNDSYHRRFLKVKKLASHAWKLDTLLPFPKLLHAKETTPIQSPISQKRSQKSNTRTTPLPI